MMSNAVQEFLRRVEFDPALQQWVSAFLEAMQIQQPTSNISYQEFLDWADEDTLAEWVNGEVCMSSPASLQHQQIERFLGYILSFYIETHELGELLPAPFQMKLANSGREPDLLFVRTEHLNRLRQIFLDGAADVVVEIVSPESAERDRGAKFLEYEAAGIPEYWLIDPIRRWMEAYQLGEEGHYVTAFAGSSGVCRSREIAGFWLRVEWLWQTPPRMRDALRELALI